MHPLPVKSSLTRQENLRLGERYSYVSIGPELEDCAVLFERFMHEQFVNTGTEGSPRN